MLKRLSLVSLAIATAGGPTAVQAAQFTFLDPAFVQQIYTGPLVGGPGMAWTSSGHLLTLNGSTILEYDPLASAVHQGTNIHPTIATHPIAGLLPGAGVGISNGIDGYIYVATGNGLQRVDPTSWTVTTPAANLPGISGLGTGGAYGITTLPNGKIVYVAGTGTNEVYVYDPVAQTNSLIYTSTGLIDDIQASPTGEIALAGQANNEIIIITAAGAVLVTVPAPLAYPDGLAFGYGASVARLFSNDNQGTITAYDFSPGYASLLSTTTIASGGSYGDLAAVGPDCALYVSQFYNGGYHNSALFGTRWDDATINNEPSIVRISSSRPGECAFAPSVGGDVPEPGAAWLSLLGLAALGVARRRPAAA
ncbi:MAG: PEP-CTERM sorting domain-containing protein [Rubrivivax sp.]|nr:PEP-CTERM sorting domain-containing protein [Rubrivivax sp.]